MASTLSKRSKFAVLDRIDSGVKSDDEDAPDVLGVGECNVSPEFTEPVD